MLILVKGKEGLWDIMYELLPYFGTFVHFCIDISRTAEKGVVGRCGWRFVPKGVGNRTAVSESYVA